MKSIVSNQSLEESKDPPTIPIQVNKMNLNILKSASTLKNTRRTKIAKKLESKNSLPVTEPPGVSSVVNVSRSVIKLREGSCTPDKNQEKHKSPNTPDALEEVLTCKKEEKLEEPLKSVFLMQDLD